MTTADLPTHHRALVLNTIEEGLKIESRQTPQAGPGNAIVRVLAANVLSYSREIYNGTRKYPFSTPLIAGTNAIGRIAAVGPDAVLLKEGQLVLIDSFVRARDDPDEIILMGIHQGHTPSSKKLMHGEWRDATYAEYVKMPLENCFPLDESVLSDKLGYTARDLADISRFAVPYGGLQDINVKPGQTVIVAPATGSFGSAAVRLAVAMGARVIAVGRNAVTLKALTATSDRIEMVQVTGDVTADVQSFQKFGPIDAFFDISPPDAAKSTHFRSCMLALRHGGQVSLMSGMLGQDLPIPLRFVVSHNIQLRGKWMYSREDMRSLIRLIEFGSLPLDKNKVDHFALDDWDAAFTAAAKQGETGRVAVIVP